MSKKVEFKPIPGRETGSYTTLSIFPPGQFINNTDYAVFVGGCGVGHKKTLKAAKVFLLEHAKVTCKRHMLDALTIVVHYEKMLAHLEQHGLEPKK